MPLRIRLTAAFLAVVVGPVVVGSLFIAVTVSTVTRHGAEDQLSAGTASVTQMVQGTCQQLESTAAAVALVFDSNSSTLATVAQRAVIENGVSSVRVTNIDNDTLVSIGEPIAAAARCGSTEPVPSSIHMIGTRVLVFDMQGRERGAVDVARVVDDQYLSELAVAAGTDVTLLDSRVNPLTSLDNDDVLAQTVSRLDGTSKVTFDVESNTLVQQVAPSADMPVPLALSVTPKDNSRLNLILALGAACSTLLALFAAWWMARSTTRPLAKLASAAEAVIAGDLNARVPVRGDDELARMSRTFNAMTSRTQTVINALESSRDQLRGQLAVLGETLSSTLDLDRMLEMIVETATPATSGAKGVLVLVDAKDPTLLVGRAETGFTGLDLARLRIRVGEGMLGGVARNGAYEGPLDRDLELAPGEPSASNVIAVPITATSVDDADMHMDARLLGVLAVYDHVGEGRFDSSDISTLSTFASQAAIAIGNVLSHHEARRLSLTDPLTGLWNYRYLQVALSREVERAGRFHRPTAVIAIDLDRFKSVNDTYGHPVGDIVLAETARRINAQIREVDLAFRYGGEEFVVLLPEADADSAAIVAARLRHAVSDELIVLPISGADDTDAMDAIRVTVSLGVAAYPEHGSDGASVLAAADGALYEAKASGRDTWRVAGRAPIGQLGSHYAPN